MLFCLKQSAVADNNNEDEQEMRSNISNFITSSQLIAYMTSEMNNQSEKLLIIDCGSPLRYDERRIKDSFLLNINDKISRKRFVNRGLKNFLDKNQLNRLNQSKIIILYDDSIHLSSSLCSNSTDERKISSIITCILNEIKRYDSSKIIYILQSSFEEFRQHCPTYCYLTSSNFNDNATSSNYQTTDIESYPMSLVLSGLYLGNEHDAQDMNLLKQNKIKVIINVSTSIPCYYENEKLFDYFRVPCNDTCQQNILQYFEKTFTFVHEKLLLNQNVFIHCQAGISRSASFVIGYLMKHHSKTFDQAYSFLKEKRNIINPNFGFLNQLTRYEQMKI